MTTFSPCSMKWQLAERLDLLLVERGLVAEVEGLQALHEGEARQVGAHGDVLGRLRGDLFGEHVSRKSA